jgi:hypothetical protein
LSAAALLAQKRAEGGHAKQSGTPKRVDVARGDVVIGIAGVKHPELIADQTGCDRNPDFGAIGETP